MIHDALFSSAREDWETPQALYAALEGCFGFRLDAAASAANAKAESFFDSAQDALAQDWAPFGRVWLNPPYGRAIGRWMQKAAAEAARGCLVVALVPARTDTRWWRDSVVGKAQVYFLCGRLRYELEGKPQGAAPFPSAVLVYAPDLEALLSRGRNPAGDRAAVWPGVDAGGAALSGRDRGPARGAVRG